MIPIPMPMNRKRFQYIAVVESILCMDRAKQYYFTMTESELVQWKGIAVGQYVHTATHDAMNGYCGIVCLTDATEKRLSYCVNSTHT